MAGIGIMELAIVATAVLLLVGFLVRLRWASSTAWPRPGYDGCSCGSASSWWRGVRFRRDARWAPAHALPAAPSFSTIR